MSSMAEAQSSLHSSKKGQRKSYTREEKLKVVAFYKENNSNLYRTCQQFDMNSKTVLKWVRSEEDIKKSKRGAR